MANLLSLPVELRLQIYEILFDKSQGYHSKSYLYPLLVCRQIRIEALPLAFQELSSFRSAQLFADWATFKRPNLGLIRFVKAIHIDAPDSTLQDLSCSFTANMWEPNGDPKLERIWTEYLSLRRTSSPRPPHRRESVVLGAWSRLKTLKLPSTKSKKRRVGEDPFTLLLQAFGAISHLRRLRLGVGAMPFDYVPFGHLNAEQELLANIVSIRCGQLEEFVMGNALLRLDFLTRFQQLQHFAFAGYSKTSPDTLLSILKGLPQLNSIRIFFTASTESMWLGQDGVMSFTPEVLAGLNPLKKFGICTINSERSRDSFLAAPMLCALRTAHAASLKRLDLESNFAVNEEVSEEIKTVVAESSLSWLGLWLIVHEPFKKKELEALSKMDIKTCRISVLYPHVGHLRFGSFGIRPRTLSSGVNFDSNSSPF